MSEVLKFSFTQLQSPLSLISLITPLTRSIICFTSSVPILTTAAPNEPISLEIVFCNEPSNNLYIRANNPSIKPATMPSQFICATSVDKLFITVTTQSNKVLTNVPQSNPAIKSPIPTIILLMPLESSSTKAAQFIDVKLLFKVVLIALNISNTH